MQRTLRELIDDIKFITGQDSLTDAEVVKLLNYAKDSYFQIAITSSGRWKVDDTTHVNESAEKTFPIATATLDNNEEYIPLDTTILAINQITITENGKKQVLQPIDSMDFKNSSLSTEFSVNGTPKYYDYDAHSIFFYPRSNQQRTVEVSYSRTGNRFTASDTTQLSGIPSIHDEYLVLYVSHKLSFRTVDTSKVDLRNEMVKWEGSDGVSGGIIRNWYSKRDQDTPRVLKTKIPNVFMKTSRGRI